MPGFKSTQTFHDNNTKVVEGYSGSTAAAPESGRVEVEKVHNTYGSCAGAGSGEFDVYRAAKRREQVRLEYLERADEEAAKKSEFEAKITGNKRAAEEKTAKNAEKRLKKKMKRKEWKAKYSGGPASTDSDGGNDNSEKNGLEVAPPVTTEEGAQVATAKREL